MKTLTSSKELDYHWAGVTAISGIVGILAYIGTSAASDSTPALITVPYFLGSSAGDRPPR